MCGRFTVKTTWWRSLRCTSSRSTARHTIFRRTATFVRLIRLTLSPSKTQARLHSHAVRPRAAMVVEAAQGAAGSDV